MSEAEPHVRCAGRAPDPGFWAGKSVCVTGGTGFLGYHLVTQLSAAGAEVRAFGLPPASGHPLLNQNEIQVLYGDVRDAGVVARALSDCDVIFNAAGLVASWGPALARMHAVHVDGTRNVLAAATANARIIHTSSITAIGAHRAPVPVDEETPFALDRLRVDYVQAKRGAEQLALDAARDRHVVVVNPGYLIGPEDYERSIMGRLCVRFWKGRVLLVPLGGFNLVDVRDVATGHLLAAEHGIPGRRYILGGENCTGGQLIRRLAGVAGLRPRALPRLPLWAMRALATLAETRAWLTRREPYPSFQQVRLGRYYWFTRSDRAQTQLGYRARPLTETLADTYRWFLAVGALSLRGINRWWMRPTDTARRAA